MGLPLKHFVKSDFSLFTPEDQDCVRNKRFNPLKIPYSFLKLTPKEIVNFYNLSQKNFIGPQSGEKEGRYYN